MGTTRPQLPMGGEKELTGPLWPPRRDEVCTAAKPQEERRRGGMVRGKAAGCGQSRLNAWFFRVAAGHMTSASSPVARRLAEAAVVAGAVATVAPAAAQQGTAVLTGTIVDAATGAPLADTII